MTIKNLLFTLFCAMYFTTAAQSIKVEYSFRKCISRVSGQSTLAARGISDYSNGWGIHYAHKLNRNMEAEIGFSYFTANTGYILDKNLLRHTSERSDALNYHLNASYFKDVSPYFKIGVNGGIILANFSGFKESASRYGGIIKNVAVEANQIDRTFEVLQIMPAIGVFSNWKFKTVEVCLKLSYVHGFKVIQEFTTYIKEDNVPTGQVVTNATGSNYNLSVGFRKNL